MRVRPAALVSPEDDEAAAPAAVALPPSSRGEALLRRLRFTMRRCLPLNPNSPWKRAWDNVLLALIIYTSVMVPFELAFRSDLEAEDRDGVLLLLVVMETFVDAFFIVDLCLNFTTAVELEHAQETIRVTSLRDIARRYVHGWFAIDLLSIGVPFTEAFGVEQTDGAGAIALLKMLRFARLAKRIRTPRNLNIVYRSLLKIVYLLLSYLLAAHGLGCCYYFVTDRIVEGESFIDRQALDQEPVSTKYLSCLYWALVTLLTVGYGDIVPVSDVERVYTMLVLLVGSVMNASVFGNVTLLLQNVEAHSRRYAQRMEQIVELIQLYQLPDNLASRLLNHAEYDWNRTKGFDTSDVLARFPQALQADVQLHMHSRLIRKVPFFANCSEVFIKRIVCQLRPRLVMRGEFLFCAGDASHEMFFLRQGTMVVLSADGSQVFSVLLQGSYVGEIGVLVAGRRTASVKAKTNCEVYALSKDSVNDALVDYPEYERQLRKTAEARLSNDTRRMSAVAVDSPSLAAAAAAAALGAAPRTPSPAPAPAAKPAAAAPPAAHVPPHLHSPAPERSQSEKLPRLVSLDADDDITAMSDPSSLQNVNTLLNKLQTGQTTASQRRRASAYDSFRGSNNGTPEPDSGRASPVPAVVAGPVQSRLAALELQQQQLLNGQRNLLEMVSALLSSGGGASGGRGGASGSGGRGGAAASS